MAAVVLVEKRYGKNNNMNDCKFILYIAHTLHVVYVCI